MGTSHFFLQLNSRFIRLWRGCSIHLDWLLWLPYFNGLNEFEFILCLCSSNSLNSYWKQSHTSQAFPRTLFYVCMWTGESQKALLSSNPRSSTSTLVMTLSIKESWESWCRETQRGEVRLQAPPPSLRSCQGILSRLWCLESSPTCWCLT